MSTVNIRLLLSVSGVDTTLHCLLLSSIMRGWLNKCWCFLLLCPVLVRNEEEATVSATQMWPCQKQQGRLKRYSAIVSVLSCLLFGIFRSKRVGSVISEGNLVERMLGMVRWHHPLFCQGLPDPDTIQAASHSPPFLPHSAANLWIVD